VSAIKLTITGGVLAVACYAIFTNSRHVVTDNAVVSVYTTSVRAPISGNVTLVRAKVGDMLAGGSVLAHLENPRVDDGHLVGLESQVRMVAADRQARIRERDGLAQLQQSLLARADRYDQAAATVATLQAAEAERQMQASLAGRTYDQHDLDRKSSLGRSGFAALSDVDHARSVAAQSGATADATMARLAYFRLQAKAAHDGVFLSNGSSDVAYSRQRADEVAMRITEIQREIDNLNVAATESAVQLAAERRRIAALRSADLVAPTDGMLWRVGATEGERLGVGDTVFEEVDCRQAFVVAAMPQEKFGDVQAGGAARVRLAGESADRTGEVVAVTSEATLFDAHNLAAMPPQRGAKTVIAWIALDAPAADPPGKPGDCAVGRTGHVILDTPTMFRSVSNFLGRSVGAKLLGRALHATIAPPPAPAL
jgi:multidrug resistance efflux pump